MAAGYQALLQPPSLSDLTLQTNGLSGDADLSSSVWHRGCQKKMRKTSQYPIVLFRGGSR